MTNAPDQKWVLITGGVADIGKGCLAATLTRYLNACGATLTGTIVCMTGHFYLSACVVHRVQLSFQWK